MCLLLLLLCICFLLSPLSPTNSHQEIFIWEEILLLTLEWPLALVFHVTSFFFLKEDWPTSNASGASPKPSLTPHRLTSTLTTNKTSFFSVNKLGSCLFSIFQKCLEAFSSLGFLLIFLTEPTLTFCLFSKLGNTNSFPEAIAWGKDFGLLQLSPALQRAH